MKTLNCHFKYQKYLKHILFSMGNLYKVEMRTVIGSQKCDGLGTTDIFSIERALETSWILISIDDSKADKIFHMHLQKYDTIAGFVKNELQKYN